MKNDNIKNKIKRNILKLIFCGQKIFRADNMWFYNGRPTTVKNVMIAENKNYILKLQIYRHRLKLNDILQEINILQILKDSGAICQPIIKSSGKDIFKRHWFVMEKINNKEGINLGDVLLAILEQHKLGIFHGDTKTDNVVFNGLIAKLIDYDQSQIRSDICAFRPKESIMFFINSLAHAWKYKNKLLEIGEGIEEVTNNCMGYFTGDAFDFSKTNLCKSFEPMPFYALDEEEIKSEGEINIKIWQEALDKIEFQAGEKVLDVNPDTGALSRYLAKRGCAVKAICKSDNEFYATKIISNILGQKIDVIKDATKALEDIETIFILNNKNDAKISQYANAKTIIVRYKDNDATSQEKLDGYITKDSIQLDENSKLVIFEKNDEI